MKCRRIAKNLGVPLPETCIKLLDAGMFDENRVGIKGYNPCNLYWVFPYGGEMPVICYLNKGIPFPLGIGTSKPILMCSGIYPAPVVKKVLVRELNGVGKQEIFEKLNEDKKYVSYGGIGGAYHQVPEDGNESEAWARLFLLLRKYGCTDVLIKPMNP